MQDPEPSESPLDAIADTVGQQTIDAFGILGNETRLAILLALWEDFDSFADEEGLSFSALYDRVGVSDSGNFTYHLDQLQGPFVEQSDAGYTLTMRAEKILRAVLAGSLAEHESFEDEAIDAQCDRCGSSIVIDYHDSTLIERCTNCEGRWESSEWPSGVLRAVYRPPAGLANRTPQMFYRHGNTWDRYDAMARLEGICPDCLGSVTNRFSICQNHDVEDGTICRSCGSFWQIQLQTICQVCKAAAQMAPFAPIHVNPQVKAFYHEHAVDPDELYDAGDIASIRETIAEKTIISEDPLEVSITIDISGDRLTMTLNSEAQVVNVSR